MREDTAMTVVKKDWSGRAVREDQAVKKCHFLFIYIMIKIFPKHSVISIVAFLI